MVVTGDDIERIRLKKPKITSIQVGCTEFLDQTAATLRKAKRDLASESTTE
jgi:hypothetical protein